MKENEIKHIVQKHYAQIANQGCCCSSCGCDQSSNEQIAKSIGYSDDEISSAPGANLGLGCGNPTAIAKIKEGDTVLDLGSGAGFDCFLSAKKVGNSGRVIGIDFSKDMIEKARQNAQRLNYQNVEFRLGDIEDLPVDDNSIDIIISNCVINLAPDKSKVFAESYRVLKDGGRMFVSDIVLLEDISEEIKTNEALLAGCVGGALLKNDYLKIVKNAGFKVKVLSEDKEISKRQYQGIPLESLKIEAIK
ncbi:MAG: Erythromycin 3''-O-methyltransferase [bacterium ADurb.Bin400]|nr:MAG: Erythromycin 3''-O-methyltransferase [bacterium ADurb.Bin400]